MTTTKKSRTHNSPNAFTRRQFFAKTGITFAGLALAEVALGDAPSRSLKAAGIFLGSGEHRYECIHDWLMPPDHIRFGDTQGVALDLAGNIYIAHTVHPSSKCGDAIAVFDKYGNFVRSWGERFRGGAHGIEIRAEGGREYAYHCDTAHRLVVKTTLDGEVVWEMGVPLESDHYTSNDPFIPTNLAFAPNGDFYVTDGYGSDWIHQFDSVGEYIRTFGGKGKEEGKVLNAHGIWVDWRGSEPVLVVADRGNSRLQYFTLDGKHIKFVRDGMRQPCHFDIRNGEMLIPDLKSVVTILDEKNRVVAQLGDGDPSALRGHPQQDFIPGKFIHPHGAKFLPNGDILVAEWVPVGRVTLLRKVG